MTARLLTPLGAGAIAVIEVRNSWPVIRQLFETPNKTRLPDRPILHRTWFGTIDLGDEVIIVVTSIDPEIVEIHCHGGIVVVRMIINALANHGVCEVKSNHQPLELAPTLRTASIILDQMNGAYERDLAASKHERLRSLIPVGKHLVHPWIVAIAGAPNAGKSSLLNALAGFQRSIVSPIAGTTRDLVTLLVAFDGWPFELIDTAGLRETQDAIEIEGVKKARQKITQADLVLWLVDAVNPIEPDGQADLIVLNKCDLISPPYTDCDIAISATQGKGIDQLISMIVNRLIPDPPLPGDGVPLTP